MKYSLFFFEDAQQDILESVKWYNQKKEKLGFEFYGHLLEQLSLIRINPLHYSIRFKNIRATKIKKYPYLIYFQIKEKEATLLILGVLHTSRNPKTIKQRN